MGGLYFCERVIYMAVEYTDAAKNLMLDALGAVITHIAIFDDAGTPAEIGTRVALEGWDSASGGEMDATPQSGESYVAEHNVPSSTTVTAVGLFSASSGGTEYARKEITPEEFTNAGIFRITDLTLDLNLDEA